MGVGGKEGGEGGGGGGKEGGEGGKRKTSVCDLAGAEVVERGPLCIGSFNRKTAAQRRERARGKKERARAGRERERGDGGERGREKDNPHSGEEKLCVHIVQGQKCASGKFHGIFGDGFRHIATGFMPHMPRTYVGINRR